MSDRINEDDEHSFEDIEKQKVSGNKTALSLRSMVILVVVIVIMLCGILCMTLPQMYIETIEITGCKVLTEEDILRESGISTGMHLFRNIRGGIVELFTLRYGNIENGLKEKYPYIGDIQIQVRFPSKVLIDVVERRRIGYIRLPDGYAVIDLEGYVVELCDGEIPAGVPQMKGLPVSSAVLNEKIVLDGTKEMNSCITVLGAILAADDNKDATSEFSLMQNVRSIRSIGNEAVYLTVYLPAANKELLVRLGSLTDISDDMTWLRYAVEQGAFNEVGEGFLDMSGEENTFSPE